MTPHAIDREEVMAYLDGELEQARRGVVEAHLEVCEDCRSLAGELRQVSLRLSDWTVTAAPTGTTQALAAIANTSGASWWRKRGLFNFPGWAVAGGVAVLTIAAAVMVPSMRSHRAEPVAFTMPTARNSQALGEAIRPGAGQGQGQGQRRAVIVAESRETESHLPQSPDRMIVRSANIALTSDKFDSIRAAIERLVAAHQGRVTSLNLTGDSSSRRSLNATLGVPATNMDALLTGLRGLGRVQNESLGSDDVTESFRDLGMRTANARREEQRLVELLSRRTGDLADVLAVERELARVRLDIERMEAETRATRQRVDLATVTLTVHEQYRADLAIGPLPLPMQFKNAVVDGFRTAAESLVGASLVVLQVAPTLLVWTLILAWPARWAWRRMRALGQV